MALTASMAISPTSVNSGEPVTVTLTVSNSTGDAVDLLEVRHTAQGLQRLRDELGELAVSVPANGTVTCSYEVRPYEDTQTISARIYGSDGSTASASTMVTVT